MSTERQKMLAGELYDPLDPEPVAARERVFFNFNCIVLDVCELRIGNYTLFGPGVQILTPLHPFDAALRRKQEFGKPIEIGADVWVGGGALILAGVHVGARAVIGAGSVVTCAWATPLGSR